MQGWIKLHRKVKEHWIYQEKRVFSKFEAWIDLLTRANHKDNKVVLGNELIDIKKGELITSIRKLCDEWKWSNTKVISFLNLLQKDEMIVYKSDTKKTVVTIVNYGIYHDSEIEETSQKHHDNDTEASRKHTDKNVKNVKNDKEVYTSKIKDLLSHFSAIDNFITLNKNYWDVIRETRTHGKVAESVVYKNMEKWLKYDLSVVEYSLKEHIQNHKGKKEEYTIGIMRGTAVEDVKQKSNNRTERKVVDFDVR